MIDFNLINVLMMISEICGYPKKIGKGLTQFNSVPLAPTIIQKTKYMNCFL